MWFFQGHRRREEDYKELLPIGEPAWMGKKTQRVTFMEKSNWSLGLSSGHIENWAQKGTGQGLNQRDADVTCLVLDVTGLSEKSHSACHAHSFLFLRDLLCIACHAVYPTTLLSWSKAARWRTSGWSQASLLKAVHWPLWWLACCDVYPMEVHQMGSWLLTHLSFRGFKWETLRASKNNRVGWSQRQRRKARSRSHKRVETV